MKLTFLSADEKNLILAIYSQSTATVVKTVEMTATKGTNIFSWIADAAGDLQTNTGEKAPPGLYYYEIIDKATKQVLLKGNFFLAK